MSTGDTMNASNTRRYSSQLENIHQSFTEGSSRITKAFGERLSNANAALRRAGSVDVTSNEPRGRRSSITGKYPPPKPPPPRLSRRLTVSSMNTCDGSVESESGSPYLIASPEVSRRLVHVGDLCDLTFDEPMVESDTLTDVQVPAVKVKRQQSLNPFLDDYEEPIEEVSLANEQITTPGVDQSLYIADGVSEAAVQPTQLVSLVPGLPRTPSTLDHMRARNAEGCLVQDSDAEESYQNLLDRDVSESTPEIEGWPALKPLEIPPEGSTRYGEGPRDSDSGSDITEGCDDTDDSDCSDFDEDDMSAELGAISVAGIKAGKNAHSPNGSDVTVKEFVHEFVDNIFSQRSNISQEDKSQFNSLIMSSYGRLAFTRYVNSKKSIDKNLEEGVFYRLVQYFVMTLLECHNEDDFRSAKLVMDMCFTYSIRGVPPKKQFLYEPLKEQAIWQSTRFWNEAFFGAIQTERSRRQHDLNLDSDNSQLEEKYLQNLTFGQLGTFMCNMRSFGLEKEFCLDFLRKQSQLYNLRNDQIELIKSNIERYSNT